MAVRRDGRAYLHRGPDAGRCEVTSLGCRLQFDWRDFDEQPPDVTIQHAYSRRGSVIRPDIVALTVDVRSDAVPSWTITVYGPVLRKDGSPGLNRADEMYRTPNRWQPEPPPSWLMDVVQPYIDRAPSVIGVQS
jgi:hypothetical protein